jgi:predicted acetyltransferase
VQSYYPWRNKVSKEGTENTPVLRRRHDVNNGLHFAIRELVIGEKVVSSVTTIFYQMRIGSTAFRMGGIASVHTDHEHRMKGYASQTMRASIEGMYNGDCELSFLYGIADFYDKFGYAVCMANHTLSIATRNAERAPTSLAMRAATADDMPRLRDIYNEQNAFRTASLVRDSAWSEFSKGSDWGITPDVLVAVDNADNICGYVAVDQSKTSVIAAEIGAVGPEQAAYGSILRALADLAIQRRCSDIVFWVPPDHSFARYAHRFGCEVYSRHPRNGGGMARIIVIDSFFRKLIPELRVRVPVETARELLVGGLALVTDIGTIRLLGGDLGISLSTSADCAQQVELDQALLCQLVFGYRSAEDVLADPKVCVKQGNPLPALRALFPTGIPYMWRPDQF